MTHPTGIALFLRRWAFTPAARGDASARVYRAGGLSWAMPVTLVSTRTGYTRKLREPQRWREYRAAGVPLHPCWILPRPVPTLTSDAQAWVAQMADLGAAGVVIDPELEMVNQGQAASELDQAVSEACQSRGLVYGLTSYSMATFHRSFPWGHFPSADYGLAQTYDRDNAFDASYVRNALESWRTMGFARPVFPCRGLNDHRARRVKSATDLRRHLALLPNPEVCGIWGPPSIPAATWSIVKAWARGARGARGGTSGVGVLAVLAGLALAAKALT